MQWDCPHQKSTNPCNVNIAEAKEEVPQPEAKEEPPKAGESLLLKRVLLKKLRKPKNQFKGRLYLELYVSLRVSVANW